MVVCGTEFHDGRMACKFCGGGLGMLDFSGHRGCWVEWWRRRIAGLCVRCAAAADPERLWCAACTAPYVPPDTNIPEYRNYPGVA